MAYIGRDTDKISNVEVLDNITFDGSSSYTLQKNSVNFTPSSANTLLVSIDGVVQAGNFTVSGSTIDFGTAVAGTSTCNFILHYGIGLITTPADGTVTTAKLASSLDFSSKTITLASNMKNTPAFEAYLSSVQSVSSNVTTLIEFDTEIFDTDGCYDNTTNYRFTPTVAGKYMVYSNTLFFGTGDTQAATIFIYKNGSVYKSTNIDPVNSSLSLNKGNVINTAIIDMNGTTDYIEIFGNVQSGSGQLFDNGNKSTYFGAYRIGA
jgi:hypothetical protein